MEIAARRQTGIAEEMAVEVAGFVADPSVQVKRTMLEVLEHIPDPEQMLPILKQLARGHVLLSVPREPFFCALNFMRGKNLRRLGNDPEHVNHWGRRGFFRFIEPHFEILAAPAVFPWTMVLARPRR